MNGFSTAIELSTRRILCSKSIEPGSGPHSEYRVPAVRATIATGEAASLTEQKPSKPPARVLLVETNDDGTVGGSHRCLFDLCRKFDRDRFDVSVLFYQNNPYVDRLRSLGVLVEVWEPDPGDAHGPHVRGVVARKFALARRMAARVRQRAIYLRQRGITLVHLNNAPTAGFSDWLPASRLMGVPCMTHAREAYRAPGTAFGRWLTRQYDRVVAISRHVAVDLERAGFLQERIRQVYDGIDLDEWDQMRESGSAVDRREFGVGPEKLMVVMAGHVRTWKGQDAVLAALSAIETRLRRDIHVIFVGALPASDSAYQERLAATVARERLGEYVTFAGYRADVASIMKAADVVLHASTVPEPLGLVVLEGMALGKAVVASSLGGPSEIVTDGSGLLFDPARPAELAEILITLQRDPGRRHALGLVALARARSFSLRSNVDGIQAVWTELIGERASSDSQDDRGVPS